MCVCVWCLCACFASFLIFGSEVLAENDFFRKVIIFYWAAYEPTPMEVVLSWEPRK